MTTKSNRKKHLAVPTEPNRCLFADSRGHQCRLFRAANHTTLCSFHAHQEQQLLDSDAIAAELASLSGEFKTVSDINHVVGKLFHLVAAGRIPARRARTLSYLAQLLLSSQNMVRSEIALACGWNGWNRYLKEIYAPPAPNPTAEAAAAGASQAAPAAPRDEAPPML